MMDLVWIKLGIFLVTVELVQVQKSVLKGMIVRELTLPRILIILLSKLT